MNAFDLHARYPGFVLAASATWHESCVALFGASGSGKSTIVEAIAGLRADVRGMVSLSGQRLDGLPSRRRGIGWVPQDAALFPHRSVLDNLRFAARPGDADLLARVVDALELSPLLTRRPSQVSGGERQRVALGRALVSRPRALLLDEPLAALDRPLRARLVPFLQRIRTTFDVPMLIVSHDPLEVMALARHVIVLEAGRVVAEGDPREVLAAHEALGSLRGLAAENVFDVSVAGEVSDGIVLVTTPRGVRLAVVHAKGFGLPRRVAITAEDIVLSTTAPSDISAQNVLAGVVQGTRASGAQVVVDVSVDGELFVVRVTAKAAQRLGLVKGRAAHLIVKAHAVLAVE